MTLTENNMKDSYSISNFPLVRVGYEYLSEHIHKMAVSQICISEYTIDTFSNLSLLITVQMVGNKCNAGRILCCSKFSSISKAFARYCEVLITLLPYGAVPILYCTRVVQ